MTSQTSGPNAIACHTAQLNEGDTWPPGALHLTPCAWLRYLELPQQADDRYELVDGLLFLCPMNDAEHHRIQGFLKAQLDIAYFSRGFQIWAYPEASVQILEPKSPLASASSPHSPSPPCSPSSPRSPSSPESSGSGSWQTRRHTCRVADIAVSRYSSAEDDRLLSPTSRENFFPVNKPPPFMAVEITSGDTSRYEDIYAKWTEYARTGVEEYVIIDRTKQCVTVGKLNGSGPRISSGDPDLSPSRMSRRIKRLQPSGSSASPVYARTIFRGAQTVDCSVFRVLGVTAATMLDPPLGQDALKSVFAEERLRRKEVEEELRLLKRGLQTMRKPDKVSGLEKRESPERKKSRTRRAKT